MVCLQEDDFVFEQPRWLAQLSNGLRIIQDDNRPGVDPPSAWLRLKEFCRQQGLYVVNLTLQFRSHHESPLPANAEGYFFRHKAVSIDYGQTMAMYLIGHVEGDKIYIQEWKIPELICVGTEIRQVDENDMSLIRRDNDTTRIFAIT